MKAAICDNEKIFLNQMAEVIGAKECIDSSTELRMKAERVIGWEC